MHNKLPDFVIIGAQKAGTSSLQHYLKMTPGVFVPPRESTHFFTNHYQKGIDYYKSLFFAGHGPAGECTRFYIMHPLVPERMSKVIPNVKIIVLLRNPVDRAFSHFQDKIRLGHEKVYSFEKVIELEEERIKDEMEIMLSGEPYRHGAPYREHTYLTKGRYVEPLKRWLKYFPREQFMIIQSEEFFKNTSKVYNQILNFIGVSNFELNGYYACNKHPYRSIMNPETRKRLVEYFKPYNEELYTLIGRRFDWK